MPGSYGTAANPWRAGLHAGLHSVDWRAGPHANFLWRAGVHANPHLACGLACARGAGVRLSTPQSWN
ncbi:hypothetical protein PGTUg99_033825 [Puccinia graminis f. sp. tritici]|uniref:Uncharacterized protein n=1 Tax=Puccinia graminis f. sp. tritici TaxID=56615 RepID=A0A5B0Q9K5_PUCGR|nr:hypothetical protein PGTUg99_033825 [Puccinia graminis f. sp. tritici]